MSHEFELHHLVSELLSLLRVTEKVDVDTQVDLLLKNRTPYITTQVVTCYSTIICHRRCSHLPLGGVVWEIIINLLVIC